MSGASSAAASADTVEIFGTRAPFSYRLMACFEVPSRRASSSCDSPRSMRRRLSEAPNVTGITAFLGSSIA